MEAYYPGLRKIKTRSDNVHRYRWPCIFVFLGAVLGSMLYPSLAIIAQLSILFWLFLAWRLSLSVCPRCTKRFYSFLTIFFGLSFFTKSGMLAIQCKSCGLKLSELPEIDEVTIQSHKDEWLK